MRRYIVYIPDFPSDYVFVIEDILLKEGYAYQEHPGKYAVHPIKSFKNLKIKQIFPIKIEFDDFSRAKAFVEMTHALVTGIWPNI